MEQTADQLAATVAALEAQRGVLGDALVDAALAPIKRELATLRARELAAAAPAPTPPTQQLKQVSVLFVDVVGSTAIGQALGPEEIHVVMDGALERFTAVVQRHHGRVLQYTGDGMLAAFGTEEASEDDVEDAVRAGLGIIDEAVQLAPTVRRQHGVPDFNVRAGVHTGRVLLGGGVDAEGSIRGATVNVAARMEQSAPPGRLRISHDSYRHVRGLFDVLAQEPVSVKGVAQPLRSYLVERAKPRAFRVPTRGIEGLETPMVGRSAQLEQLQTTFHAVLTQRSARALTVVGEAGLGKSRLLAEFQQGLNLNSCWLLLARAHPRSAVQPYGLLRDMLARQLQIGPDDSAAEARQKLVAGLAPLFIAEGEAPAQLVGHLIGLDFSASSAVKDLLGDEQAFTQRAFEATALCLRRLGQSMPVVVLVLDDLHWADAGTLAFMRYALQHNHDTPLLCLMLTRPTFFEQHADWMPASDTQARLHLAPLDKAFSQALAESLLARLAEVPAALRALVTSGAEGNPFYMEELVKMFIDDGVIVVEPEGWRVVSDKLLGVQVPPTLAGVLQARLDALLPPERSALQQAAVVGQVFWEQALAAIDRAAVDVLPALLRKQLIVRHDAPGANTQGEGTREYTFGHNLLHQVTYDGVLKAPKRSGHERVGQFWTQRAEVANALAVDPTACRALAEAQYHRCLADAPAYVVWFEGQFSHYLGAYAVQTLRPLAQQLVDVCEQQFGADDAQTAKALTNLARVILVQGSVAQAEPLLRRALAIQEAALGAEHADTARTLAVLGGYHQGRGDLAAAEPYFKRALDIRQRVLGPEHALSLGTLDNLAKVTLELGRLDEAEVLSRRVLAVHERRDGPEHPDTAFAMTALGEVLAKQGELAQAEPLIRRALAVQRASLPAEHPDIGLSMWHLAEVLHGLSRDDEAEPLARSTLAAWEASFGAEHEWTAWGLISLAGIRLAQGAAPEAAELAARAGQLLRALFGDGHAAVASAMSLHERARRVTTPG